MKNTEGRLTTNDFVSYLASLSAGRSHVLELGADDFTISTNSLQSLIDKINSGSSGIVILTGNAGHGKTHLCAASLCQSKLDIEWPDALRMIQDFGNGEAPIPLERATTEIFLIKDLTELSTTKARDLLIEAVRRFDDRLTIICANEGRLRTVTEEDSSPELQTIFESLRSSLLLKPQVNDQIQIINLNFQKVSSESTSEVPSIFKQLMDSWTESKKWEPCLSCPVFSSCAIRLNKEAMSSEHPLSIQPYLQSTVHLAELIGYQFTIRQLLVAIATAITNGKDCTAYQSSDLDVGNLTENSIFTSLFKSVEQHPTNNVLKAFSSLDPGLNSNNLVDSEIDFAEQNESIKIWWKDLDQRLEDPFWQPHLDDWRLMRRIYVMTRPEFGGSIESLGEVLRIEFLQLFRSAVNSKSSPEKISEIKRLVFRGLEAIQGIRTKNLNSRRLNIADQSFSDPSLGLDGIAIKNTRRDPDGTRLLASQIQMKDLEFQVEEDLGNRSNSSINHFANRFFFFPKNVENKKITIDYLDFLYLLSAANGLNASQFFAGQSLRILRSLDSWADVAPLKEATLLYRGDEYEILWENNRMEIDRG